MRSATVREATAADAAEIVRLLALLGHDQPAGDATTRIAAFLTVGEQILVAAQSSEGTDAPLLGVASLHVTPVIHRAGPIGRITALVVDEHLRGQGIGRILVAAAEEVLAARGCVAIEVTSNKKRTDAHAFYERLGYTPMSLRFVKPLV